MVQLLVIGVDDDFCCNQNILVGRYVTTNSELLLPQRIKQISFLACLQSCFLLTIADNCDTIKGHEGAV